MLGAILPLHDVRYPSDNGRMHLVHRTDIARLHPASRPHGERAIVISRMRRLRSPAARDEQLSGEQTSVTSKLSDEQNPSWWSQTGSNRRPPACKAGALPTELWPLPGSSSQGSLIRTLRAISDY